MDQFLANLKMAEVKSETGVEDLEDSGLLESFDLRSSPKAEVGPGTENGPKSYDYEVSRIRDERKTKFILDI